MWFVKNVSCQLGKSCDLYSTTSVFYFIYLFFALAAENGAEEAVSVQTWSCGFNSEPVVSSAHKLHLPNVVSQDVVVL